MLSSGGGEDGEIEALSSTGVWSRRGAVSVSSIEVTTFVGGAVESSSGLAPVRGLKLDSEDEYILISSDCDRRNMLIQTLIQAAADSFCCRIAIGELY